MKKITIFGGTGGIGQVLSEIYSYYPKEYSIDIVGSDKCDLQNEGSIVQYCNNNIIQNLIILSGINKNGQLHKQSFKDIKDQININIIGVTQLITKVLDQMRDYSYGRIILASSIIEEISTPGTAVYSSCKGYYETLVRNIAKENAKYNITANCLKLGYMDAGMTYTQIPEDIRMKIKDQIPCRKFGSISNVFNICNALIDSDYINGSVIRIAGGL